MKIPAELKHKPVIVSENYNLIDGRYDPQKTDAQGLSLGLAQWNERGSVEIAAKVWRYTGEKWSRQSEELPLHRVLDLAILICKSKKFFSERYHKNEKEFPKYPLLERIGLQGGAMNVAICTDNPHIENDLTLFEEKLHRDDEIISERLNMLYNLIRDIKEL